VSTLCNQEAGQKTGGFLHLSKKRLRNRWLTNFIGAGTVPEYDTSGNTTLRIESCGITFIYVTRQLMTAPDWTGWPAPIRSKG
jgi:hypothetical protein